MALLLQVRGADWHRRCTIHCHTASRPECDCCCGGVFHGAAGAGRQLAVVARAYLPDLIDLWRRAELRGDARILFARADLLGPPLISQLGRRRRPLQLTLPYEE